MQASASSEPPTADLFRRVSALTLERRRLSAEIDSLKTAQPPDRPLLNSQRQTVHVQKDRDFEVAQRQIDDWFRKACADMDTYFGKLVMAQDRHLREHFRRLEKQHVEQFGKVVDKAIARAETKSSEEKAIAAAKNEMHKIAVEMENTLTKWKQDAVDDAELRKNLQEQIAFLRPKIMVLGEQIDAMYPIVQKNEEVLPVYRAGRARLMAMRKQFRRMNDEKCNGLSKFGIDDHRMLHEASRLRRAWWLKTEEILLPKRSRGGDVPLPEILRPPSPPRWFSPRKKKAVPVRPRSAPIGGRRVERNGESSAKKMAMVKKEVVSKAVNKAA